MLNIIIIKSFLIIHSSFNYFNVKKNYFNNFIEFICIRFIEILITYFLYNTIFTYIKIMYPSKYVVLRLHSLNIIYIIAIRLLYIFLLQ